MSDVSWAEIKRLVHKRALFRCEYCQMAQRVIGQAMHIEHIIPGSGHDLTKLCLSCSSCNFSKAKATSAEDPDTGIVVALFNPRTQVWSEHFQWVQDGQIVQGRTPTGRATVARLKMNQPRIVEARGIWVRAGVHPPR
jgi:HNH endonuclease